MKKYHYFELSDKKLLLSGLLHVLVGCCLFLFGSQAPRVAFEGVTLWLFLTAFFSLFTRWFRKKESRENLGITFAKLILSIVLSTQLVENAIIYVLVLCIGLYQIFVSVVNGITYWLYRMNQIKPRLNYLIDSIWLALFGFGSIFQSKDDQNVQVALLGWYIITLGVTYVRDGIWFRHERGKNQLKRRVRVTLPIVFAALLPITVLKKFNAFLQSGNHETAESGYNQEKPEKTAELEVFIHTSETNLFGSIGHVDICYNNQVISYGNYDPVSEKLFGTIGDGVLFKVNREKYIEMCQVESKKTLFGYGIDLTKNQQEAIEKQLDELEQLTVPFEPKESQPYALHIRTLGGRLFKFTSSKFKTYFVLSTNCVLLADTIIGKSGTDVLSVKGFISPGTYQDYLEREFARPNSVVVSKKIYTKQ